MSRKTFLRSTAGVAAAALAAGLGVFAVQPAQAAVLGGASFNPSTGNANTLLSITTDGPCAAPATRVRVIAAGFGFNNGLPAVTYPAQTIVSPTAVGFSTSSPMTLTVGQSFKVYATNNGSTPLVGDYDIRVQCLNSAGTTVFDEYRNRMTWTTPGNSYANIDSATFTSVSVPDAPAATSTSLTADPASPVEEPDYGDPALVDLTATVTAGGAPQGGGTVEFLDGTTSLGTAPVNGAGVAVLQDEPLLAGTYDLTARYSGLSATIGDFSNNGIAGSTSASLAYEVTTKAAAATSTSLNVTGSGQLNTPATLDAVVSISNAPGVVKFFDGASLLASVPVASGTAQYVTSNLPLGTRSLKAVYESSNTTEFAGSESSVVTYEVIFSGVSDEQTVNVSVPEGELAISIDGDSVVDLATSITADGSRFTGSGAMDDVRIIDTRAGSPGWNVNGQLGAFTYTGTAAGDTLDNSDLGWAPVVRSVTGSQVVTDGADVAPAFTAAPADQNGLANSRQLAASPAGSSTGTAVIGAVLSVNAPTTIASGVHTATLTFTAI